jgi:hypothetical protein
MRLLNLEMIYEYLFNTMFKSDMKDLQSIIQRSADASGASGSTDSGIGVSGFGS